LLFLIFVSAILYLPVVVVTDESVARNASPASRLPVLARSSPVCVFTAGFAFAEAALG